MRLRSKYRKRHSFRNFVIIIIVIRAIIVIGLVLYFVLVNHAGLDLSAIFSKGVQTVEYNEDQGSGTQDYSGTAAPVKEKLSEDQNRVISLFGYPDQFTIIFDEESNNKRIDTWVYLDIDTLFIFDNGIYEGSEVYYSGKHKEAQCELMPQDFDFVNL